MDYSKLSDKELDQLVLKKVSAPESSAQDYSKLSDEELDRMVLAKASATQPKNREGQAFLESYGNAATMGYLPHLQAATYPLMESVLSKVTGKDVQSDETYVQRRDENIKRQADLRAENPKASLAGTVAGAIGGGLILPTGNAVRAKTFLPSWKAASIGRGAQAAGVGAGLGFVANPGDTEGKIDPLQIDERLDNAGIGAMVGPIAQGGVEVATKGVTAAANLPQTLKDFAERTAFKTTEASAGYRKKLGRDGIQKIGRVLLDEGIVQPGSSLDDIATAAIQLKDKTGKEIGEIITQLSDDEARLGLPPVSRSDIVASLRKQLIKESRGVETVDRANSVFNRAIDTFEKSPDNLTVGALQEIKKTLQSKVNFNRPKGADIPVDEQFERALLKEVKEALENRAGELASKVGRAEYEGLKKLYGATKQVEKITNDSVARQDSRRFISPSDYMTGGFGAIIGGAQGDDMESRITGAAAGATLGLANKGFRHYGNPIVAVVSDKVSQILQRQPNLLKPYVVPLVEAARQGPAAYQATVVNFMKDPKFVAAIDSDEQTEMASESPQDAVARELKARDLGIKQERKPVVNKNEKLDAIKRRLHSR